jgi:hypothetical protein
MRRRDCLPLRVFLLLRDMDTAPTMASGAPVTELLGGGTGSDLVDE